MTDAQHYRDLLRPVLGGRRTVIAVEVLQAAVGWIPLLRDVGAERPFVLAGALGTGPVPSEDDAEVHLLDLRGGSSIMDNIRSFEAALHDLPAAALAALDAYDPGREAVVLGTLFTHGTAVAGRRLYGGRPLEWEAIEDKIGVDEILEAAGVPRAPSEVAVPADASSVARRLDRGLGTAWAGDAREGWWGGAAYLRWVRSDADAREALGFLGASCDRVRVMPFLEGIPCSIHGMVFPDAVIAFRPVEMLTLRRTGRSDLLYAGLATYWDPPDADRDAMRATARSLGEHLRERFDYRGAFTLDGVLTADGFLPTEVNARPGAGLFPQVAASGVPIAALNKMLIEREEADYRPDDLEHLVVAAADAKRGGSCYTIFPSDQKRETASHAIAERDGRFVAVPDGEAGDGTLTFGPSHAGGFVRYEPDAAKLRIGDPFAPVAAEVFAFTDAEFRTSFGPLEPARDVR